MKRTLIPMLAASTLLVLHGCGGGGNSNASNSSGGSTYTVTGTVPGTLIEAFCDDGSYAATHSQQNGTSQHPFQLDLPTGTACQLVMTMNESDPANKTVTPIALANGEALKGVKPGARVDLGFVDLPRSPNDTARWVDNNHDGVRDNPLDVTPQQLPTDAVEVTRQSKADIDGDGIPNAYDGDMDGDGIPNNQDSDANGDGIPDAQAPDSDSDGIPDMHDHDITNAGHGNRESGGNSHSNFSSHEGGEGHTNGYGGNEGNENHASGYGENEGGETGSNSYGDNESGEGGINGSGYTGGNAGGGTSAGTTFAVMPPLRQVTLPTAFSPDNTGGQLLGSLCAQCHGTFGCSQTYFPRLGPGGEGAGELFEFFHINADSNMMAAQAQGYTSSEAQAIGAYYSQLQRQCH